MLAVKEGDLAWALEIGDDPFRHDPETLVMAMGTVRHWRTELKSELRSLSRKTEPAEYGQVKKQEERLEGVLLTLRDAWLTQLNARKNGG